MVSYREMKKALMAYKEVLRLVKRLPEDTRPYYAKYVRENFVNYREIDANDSVSLHELLQRTYNHSIWILKKYSVDQSAANRLKEICSA
ncbi:LYR motif-containing protein At3g19508 [Ipomoea triloba]|uniref:LYR motif-containing protein At3g19508 n=1 Tax=Ipomoea triloba TaxID=35885 RepID=UPI00125E0A38|nr:LYR motif-containing protein At3g19508 [Ipomoea triloba]